MRMLLVVKEHAALGRLNIFRYKNVIARQLVMAS